MHFSVYRSIFHLHHVLWITKNEAKHGARERDAKKQERKQITKLDERKYPCNWSFENKNYVTANTEYVYNMEMQH